MALDSLPANPDPANDSPQSFSEKAAAMVLAQKRLVEQWNTEIAGVNSLFAGGAYAFMYGFDGSDVAADPGPGKLRIGANAQNAATSIYIDPVTVGGGNIDGLLVAIGSNLSLLKGAVRIVKASDPARWALYDINEVVAQTGFRRLAVTWRAGSSASPFASGDALMVFLDRTGDRAVDLSPTPRIGGGTINSGTLNVDYLNLFSDDYYRYKIELTGVTSSATDTLSLRMAIAGAVITSSSYGALAADGGGTTTRTASFAIGTIGGSGMSMTIDIRGARSASRKSVGAYGSVNSANNYSKSAEGVFDLSSALSGFRLYAAGAGVTLDGGQIDIYGYRKV